MTLTSLLPTLRDSLPAPFDPDATTVVITHVVEVEDAVIVVDAHLDEIDPVWREARLLGRISHARDVRFDIGESNAPTATVILPGDIREGDLLAMPCAGYRSVGEVRCAGVVTR